MTAYVADIERPDMLEPGTRVLVPNPDGGGKLRATVVEPGDPADPIAGRDACWVQYDEPEREGTLARHAYSEIEQAQ